ncbi:MAG: squalene/phytoene synthase family protein, partial [Pseudomonadota bacterium]|nr:squalene/phytoene synthase family protein [Pseudomonadota bacterium]
MIENSAAIEFCRVQFKKEEPERYFISLFAPKTVQASLWSIFAFNSELSKIKNSVTEPMIGRIRLQWWRESLEKLEENNSRGHYILEALQTLLVQKIIQLSDLMSLIDAREIE